MMHKILLAWIVLSALHVQAQTATTNDWNIIPCLKYDAFCFINALSKDEFHNRMYPRDYTLWRGRLGDAIDDSIYAIANMTGSIGYKASHLFTYLPILSLNDLIDALQDTAKLRERIQSALRANQDQRYQASINDLNLLLPHSGKLRSIFRRMREEGWEEDWQAITKRLSVDVSRKASELTKYSPAFLKAQVTQFLGVNAQLKDSSSTVYYLYYAYPNSFKLPYNMMATWNIEEPKYFFSVYLHEMLHSFSIYQPELIALHNNLVRNSPGLAAQREILTKQLYESDDEFYVLAAEAFLSVKLGIRTDQEAIHYLKSSDGGTVVYSLLIYDSLRTSFNNENLAFNDFLKDVFFQKVTSKEVEQFLTNTK